MKQITSQEMWGGPARNNVPSNIPKVKAWINELSLVTDPATKKLTRKRELNLRRKLNQIEAVDHIYLLGRMIQGSRSVMGFGTKMGTLKLK